MEAEVKVDSKKHYPGWNRKPCIKMLKEEDTRKELVNDYNMKGYNMPFFFYTCIYVFNTYKQVYFLPTRQSQIFHF